MSAGAASHPLPDVAQVKDLLGMLFDALSVKLGPKLDVSPKAASYFGVYVSDDGTAVALCGCDIAFAANSGPRCPCCRPTWPRKRRRTRSLRR